MAIFQRFSDLSKGNLQIAPDGKLPLDGFVGAVITQPRIAMLLAPMQVAQASRNGGGGQGEQQFQDPTKTALQQEVQSLIRKLSEASQSSGGGKGSKKGNNGKQTKGAKKGSARKFIPMPRELVGYEPMKNGVGLCFAYNMAGCNLPCSSNGGCAKGVHCCIKCRSSTHGLRQCVQ